MCIVHKLSRVLCSLDVLVLTVGTQRAYFELNYFKIVKMHDAIYSLKMAAGKWRQNSLF